MSIGLIGTAFLLLASAPTPASPDGAEWEVAAQVDGCRSCHLTETDPDVAARDSIEALAIEGLPGNPEPGQTYALRIVLSDPALKNAGFLLSIETDGLSAGELETTEPGIETDGARARSGWDAQWPDTAGAASWQLNWKTPESLPTGLRIELWANAGNDDASPLGDTVHHRSWALTP